MHQLSRRAYEGRMLLVHLPRRLREEGFTVLMHSAVPPGDEGLSLGRACAGML